MIPIGYDLIEKRTDGTTVVYIAFWRHLVFGILFAFGFYVLISGTVRLYQELPAEFWNRWSKEATLTLAFFCGAIAMPFFAVWFLKSGYKKIQLEIGRSRLRYLKVGIRGGILFSETYGSVKYSDITNATLKNSFIGNNIIEIQTAYNTHKVILLLPGTQQLICYQALQEAIQRDRIATNKGIDPIE